MDDQMTKLMEEAIGLELNVSDLYLLFYELFPEDMDFWWKISNEEKNHAALLKSSILYLKIDMFPYDLLYKNLKDLQKTNISIKEKINLYRTIKPAKDEAYSFAYHIENSASEFHVQSVLSRSSDNKVLKILKTLNKDDNDHADRILQLMKHHDLSLVNL